MKQLHPDESELVGHWQPKHGAMKADEACERIEWLVANQLSHIANDESGWVQLYRDPDDGRYWRLTYPQSEMHGGGPPALTTIDEKEARETFTIP